MKIADFIFTACFISLIAGFLIMAHGQSRALINALAKIEALEKELDEIKNGE